MTCLLPVTILKGHPITPQLLHSSSLQEYTECSSDMFYLLQDKITQPHNTKYSHNNLWNYIICSFHLLSFIFISEDEVRI